MLSNYDPNERWGKHTIKVKFQTGEYKGYLTYQVNGNCKGVDVFDGFDVEELAGKKIKENQVGFEMLDEDWYRMILKNDKGCELIDESELKYLGERVVGIEIIDFLMEETK